jgi:Family of unknown function (DUF5995)
MFPYDLQLLAAVSAPAADIPDVIRIMQTIDALCVPGDGLKWFNGLYLQVTEAVAARISGGGFADPGWIAALDVEFAGLYFGALRSSLSGGAATGSWRALFSRRDQTAIARIQFALAGVNAHINHDLPIAIVATSNATGKAPNHGTPQYNDYTNLNATLESLVDSAKQQLQVRLLGDILPPVSRLEDVLAAFSVSAAREAAWNNAEVLWALRSFPGLRDRTISTIDGLTTLAGKSLLVPVPAVQAVIAG